ncbi:nucleotide exchange factor GrpE [Desulfobulbus sp. F4]|nr:nucleotide exchange factor GrpE [Desulfobulbus sp. F3]MCW5200398.1 nucleotide exchange factor GrpE [Desulfobulbus sp. F4]
MADETKNEMTEEAQPQPEAVPAEEVEILEAVEEAGPDVAALTKELEDTRAKLDQVTRFAAEAENSRKRMERDKEKLLKYAGENILRELLNTADNLERAIEQGKVEGGDAEQKLAALLAGVELTKKGLDTMLERCGVTPVSSVGQPFNPDQMDALTMEASEELPANHVVKEFAKGYAFKDKVLRHAQVVVSSGPAKAE